MSYLNKIPANVTARVQDVVFDKVPVSAVYYIEDDCCFLVDVFCDGISITPWFLNGSLSEQDLSMQIERQWDIPAEVES